MKEFIKSLIPYILIIVSVVIIRSFVITPVRVDGLSMFPTLSDSEVLLLKKFDKKYDRFDIIVFKNNDDKLVKRIIGLPGETVKIRDNKLYINDKYIKENFTHNNTLDYKLEGVIPDGKYFVLGDNRGNSLDSRSSLVGLVDKKIFKEQ